MKGGGLEKAAVVDFNPLPKLGQYKARMRIYSIVLAPTPHLFDKRPPITIAFEVDQLLYCPIGARAQIPDSSGFLTPAISLPDINEEGFFDRALLKEMIQKAAARAALSDYVPSKKRGRQREERIDIDELFS